MSLKNNIKLVLATLDKVIKQTPFDKQPFISHKIFKINQKYSKLNPQQNQASYLKQLQFNLNFVRLSFPYLDYSPPKLQTSQQNKSSQPQNQVNLQRAKQQFIQLENKQKVLQFVQQTEKVLKGVRQQVQFSNWGTGNVDPQDLKRHQELLKRQYFAGEFWKDKQKPLSPSASYLMDLMHSQPEIRQQKIQIKQEEQVATFKNDPNQNWQKVKR